METIINEINEQLRTIIADVEERKELLEKELASSKSKIEEKINEAKSYKIEVDNSKDRISEFEEEIISLEKDLSELNERFGNKSLTAVIAAGNKEINSLILEKENEIYNHRKKINELTERARTIKELLINLKKDKESKIKKLDEITSAYNYYKREFDRIIDFSSANPHDLEYKEDLFISKENKEDISNVDSSPVFEEIESMNEEETVSDKETTVESFNLNGVEKDDLSLFEHDKTQKIDFKTLNDSIDKEYSNIFGESLDDEMEESSIDDNTPVPQDIPDDIFSQNDLQDENPTLELSIPQNEDEKIVNYFTSKGVDYYSFDSNIQELLKNDFNEIKFDNLINLLDKYNIDLNNIYDATNLFNLKDYTAFENVIALLLKCGQSPENIGYVLSSLPIISAANLQEVIESYGNLIKNTNITEIILKAKKLNDLPGGDK